MSIDRTLGYNALVDETTPGSGTPIDKALIGSILDWVDAVLDSIDDKGALSLAASSQLTIATDAVTLTAGNTLFSIETEGGAASDNLATINLDASGRTGRILVLKPANVAHVVTVKHGTGNIQLRGGDFVMNDANHRLILIRDGTTWYELSRNTAGTAAGADTQVQFNDGGNIGGDSGLTFNKTTDALTLAGLLTLSAGQIKFPATQNASSDVNTLDDYEEGDWTPVIGGTTSQSGQTYTNQIGKYVKVGKMVGAWCNVTLSAKGTITGNVQVSGIPFATDSNLYGTGAVEFASLSTNWVSVIVEITASYTAFLVKGATAAATSNSTSLVAADIANATQFIIGCTYRASA